MMEYTALDRAVIQISGEDTSAFLQGIISNDIAKVSTSATIYTCLLSPQGKFLFDFFIAEYQGSFLIDVAKSRSAELIKRLLMYKLRSKVEATDVSADWQVIAAFGGGAIAALTLTEKTGDTTSLPFGFAFTDPRDARLGARVLVKKTQGFENTSFTQASPETYDAMRISFAIPDAEKDIPPDTFYPLHFRMEALNAIDFLKGCYVGQEVTARMKHRDAVKKMLFRVTSEHPFPPTGAIIKIAGVSAGEVRSSNKHEGLALLDIQAIEKTKTENMPLEAEGITLTIA